MIKTVSKSMVYSPITCCAATRWASTAHGMRRPQHKKAVGAFRPLERGVVAYSFVHLDCLPPSPIKSSFPLKTIGEACRQQAQALIEALILYAHERLQLGQRAEDIFAYVFAKQTVIVR